MSFGGMSMQYTQFHSQVRNQYQEHSIGLFIGDSDGRITMVLLVVLLVVVMLDVRYFEPASIQPHAHSRRPTDDLPHLRSASHDLPFA
jgi:hypothetical protein